MTSRIKDSYFYKEMSDNRSRYSLKSGCLLLDSLDKRVREFLHESTIRVLSPIRECILPTESRTSEDVWVQLFLTVKKNIDVDNYYEKRLDGRVKVKTFNWVITGNITRRGRFCPRSDLSL